MTDLSDKMRQTGLKFLLPSSPDETYPLVIKETMKLVGAQYGSIFLENKGKLERVFASSPLLYKTTIQHKGNTYSAFHNKKTVIINADSVKDIHPIISDLGIKSTLYIPIAYKNHAFGVISLDAVTYKQFSKKQLQKFHWLGSIAALSIQKAKERKEIKDALENRDLFISMASHELKTPLTTINMYTQLLRKKIEKNNSFESEWMETLSSEINRLTMLVNDLLRVETIETGYMNYRWKECSIQSIVGRAIQDFKLNYPHKISVEDHLQEGDDIIWGDFDKLLQVVINILNNAAKFSPSNSEITIVIKSYYKTIKVEIIDHGKGIAKKDLPKIFDKYYRGNSKNTHSGMGLGLFLVRTIIENHNGHIEITSQLNKRTTVEITLPQYRPWEKKTHRNH